MKGGANKGQRNFLGSKLFTQRPLTFTTLSFLQGDYNMTPDRHLGLVLHWLKRSQTFLRFTQYIFVLFVQCFALYVAGKILLRMIEQVDIS